MDVDYFSPNVLIPNDLELNPLFPGWKDAKKDWAAILIDLILYHQLMPFRKKKKSSGPKIHSAFFKQYVSPKLKKELCGSLEDAKVIECNHSYLSGVDSMEYRISKPYLTGMKKWAITAKNPMNRLRDGRQKELEKKFTRIKKPIGHILFDDLFRLSFDDGKAHEIIESLEYKSATKRVTAQFRYEVFCMKRIWATIDDYGRFQSSLTILNKELRKALLADNEPLIELDVSNSQPLILSAHLGTGTRDLKVFRKQTESGEFYDRIIDTLELPIDEDARKSVKLAVCKAFQGRDIAEYRKGVAHYLWNTFPSVMAYLDNKKLNHLSIPDKLNYQFDLTNMRVKPDPHKLASHELQRLESEVMIDGIAAQFKADFQTRFLGTIHDGFLVNPDLEDSLRHIILQKFKPLGVQPIIKNK